MLKPALATFLLFSSATYADVTLTLPNNAVLLVVNEQLPDSNIHKAASDSLTLPDGKNQIVYKLQTIINAGSSQSGKYESKPLVLTFTSQDANLELDVPSIRSTNDARRFDAKHEVTLIEFKGSFESYSNEPLPLPAAFSFDTDFVAAVKAYNEKLDAPIVSKPEPIETTELETNATNNMAQSQLRYWFEQADKDTQQRFIEWAKDKL